VTRSPGTNAADAVFMLENGARMDQKKFHSLYKRTPEGFRAQLIRGIVYATNSRTTARHGSTHARAVYWLCLFAADTPGLAAVDRTTHLLGEESELEPDASLFVLPRFGGRVTTSWDGFLSGPAELVVEVANTSRSIELGAKKQDYEQAGVREYVVVLAREQSVVWFARADAGFAEVPAGTDGLFRSAVFPGLWLDPRGLFSPTTRPLTAAVKQGLASPKHAAFVAELEARRVARRGKKPKPGGPKPRKSK
jgi:Uma2 family endonuclease